MLRYVMFGLFLLTAVQCDVHLEEVQARETPGLSQKEYILVEKDTDGNDQVVGHVLQIHTNGRGLGRRFGLAGTPSPLLNSLTTLMERIPGHILQPLQRARCSMMREMNDDFTLLNQRLGSRLAPVFMEGYQSAVADSEGRVLDELFGEADPQTQAEEDARLFGSALLPVAEDFDLPFQLQPIAWQQRGWEGREWLPRPEFMEGLGERGYHHHMHGHGPHHSAGENADPNEHHHNLMHLGGARRNEELSQAPWIPLKDTAVRPPSRDSINWSLYDKDGKLNLGLVGFISLSAGCLGVWVAGLVSWISYSRAMRFAAPACPARRQFLTSMQSDLVKPLMAEDLMGSSKLYTGVEFAADHAARDSSYAGLNYEALKGDPQ